MGPRDLRGRGRGRTLAILANGPSLLAHDTARLKGRDRIDTLTINRPDERAWPTTYWAYSDLVVHRRHAPYRAAYAGTILAPDTLAPHLDAADRGRTVFLHRRPGPGFSRDLDRGYHLGLSTTYGAMQAALWMDYDRVYLLGLDMNPEGLDGRYWFYGANPDADPAAKGPRFAREAAFYDHAAAVLAPEERARFVLCSDSNPWPFKAAFGSCEQRQAIDQILSSQICHGASPQADAIERILASVTT